MDSPELIPADWVEDSGVLYLRAELVNALKFNAYDLTRAIRKARHEAIEAGPR